MKKRILCILLSLLMVLSLVPAGALAQEEETPVSYDNCAAGEAIVCMEKASPLSQRGTKPAGWRRGAHGHL